MKITKITASEETHLMTNKEYLFELLDKGELNSITLVRELLHYISENDAEEIINTFELEHIEEYDEY